MVATVEDDGSNPLSNIIKLATQSRNASKGPTLFVFKTMVVSTTSGFIFGLGAGLMAPPLLGPGFSTILGMGAGFVGGLVHRWRTNLSQAASAMDEYPELMRFHIKQSLAIAAIYGVCDALDAIRRHQEEQIIEQYMARAAARVTQQFSDCE